jgi:hypothetical protein
VGRSFEIRPPHPRAAAQEQSSRAHEAAGGAFLTAQEQEAAGEAKLRDPASSSPGARSGFLPPIADCCSSQVHRLGSLTGALLTSNVVRPFFSPSLGWRERRIRWSPLMQRGERTPENARAEGCDCKMREPMQ